jgi:hypothetical protein
MRILYVASYDVSDLKGGNGIDHFKLGALQAAGCKVERLSPIIIEPPSRDIVSRGVLKLRRVLTSDDNVVRKKRLLQKVGNAIAAHPLHVKGGCNRQPQSFRHQFLHGLLAGFLLDRCNLLQHGINVSTRSTRVREDEVV